jgi:hypothetical protein
MFHYLKALYTMPAGLQLILLVRHSTILAVANIIQYPPLLKMLTIFRSKLMELKVAEVPAGVAHLVSSLTCQMASICMLEEQEGEAAAVVGTAAAAPVHILTPEEADHPVPAAELLISELAQAKEAE